ncbi:MAG: hypothetical protein ACOY3I_09095 [Verrucomicrobiota bacterium]
MRIDILWKIFCLPLQVNNTFLNMKLYHEHRSLILPPEVADVFQKKKMPLNVIKGYFAQPSFTYFDKPTEIEWIDASLLLQPFFGKKELHQALRLMEMLNGCKRKCDTCYEDVGYPTKMFTYESLVKVFSDPLFLNMLQPDILRIGTAGNILDHPQGIKMLNMMLETTSILDEQRRQKEGNSCRHKIVVFNNYRLTQEKQLDMLLGVAQKNPERIHLVISVPFNRTNHINEQFDKYRTSRSKFFQMHNISVNDVRKTRYLCYAGRVMPEEVYIEQLGNAAIFYGDAEGDFKVRGSVEVLANPDALWLKIHATTRDSYTGRIFTPITPKNLKYFSYLNYYHMASSPSNWKGSEGCKHRLGTVVANDQRQPPRIVEVRQRFSER